MFILLFIFAAFAAFPRRVTVIICALALWPHTQTHHPQSQGEEGGERPAHMCDHRAWQHFGLIEVNPWLALTIFYAWLPFAIPRSPFPLAALRFVSIRFLFDFVAVVDVVVVSIKFTTQNAVGQTNKQTSKSTHRQTNKQTKPKGKHFYKVADDDANEKERPPPLPAFRAVTLRNWRPQTGYLKLATVLGWGRGRRGNWVREHMFADILCKLLVVGSRKRIPNSEWGMWNATLDWAQLDPLHMYTHTHMPCTVSLLFICIWRKYRSCGRNWIIEMNSNRMWHVACEFSWLVSCWQGVWVGEGDFKKGRKCSKYNLRKMLTLSNADYDTIYNCYWNGLIKFIVK